MVLDQLKRMAQQDQENHLHVLMHLGMSQYLIMMKSQKERESSLGNVKFTYISKLNALLICDEEP